MPIRNRTAFVVLILIAQISNGCASAPAPSNGGMQSAVPVWTIPANELSTRRLYRISYAGDQGQASLRVALFLVSTRDFSISASDTFGRSIWDLMISPKASLFVDHRNDQFCEIDETATLPGPALQTFPIQTLPLVLLGRLPLPPREDVVSRDGRIAFEDTTGRQWTATVVDGSIKSWTLWLEGEPSVWWSRSQAGGFFLSHRQGGQIRWKETVVEELDENFSVADPPSSYQRIDCTPAQLPELEEELTRQQGSDASKNRENPQ